MTGSEATQGTTAETQSQQYFFHRANHNLFSTLDGRASSGTNRGVR